MKTKEKESLKINTGAAVGQPQTNRGTRNLKIKIYEKLKKVNNNCQTTKK
jgi:hypothetical protein